MTLTLQTQTTTHFEGWTLKADNGQDFAFEASGKLSLTPPNPSTHFEIFDPEQQLRFVGAWKDYRGQVASVIVLPEAGLMINQVVSVDRFHKRLFVVPAEIEVIKPADQPELTTSQTSDWLKGQAEILVQKTNLGGGSPIMRGMSGNRVLLMMDGFRLNNSTYRLGLNQYLNTVPSDLLQQIEVISGPSGVLYGSDGLGGTIHMRSQDPSALAQPQLAYRGSVSSADGTNSHRASGNAHLGAMAIQGHFRHNTYENLEAAAPVKEQQATGYASLDASLNATYRLSERSRLRLMNLVSQARDVPRTDRVLSGRDLMWNYQPQNQSLHGLRFDSELNSGFADHLDMGLAYLGQEEGTQRIAANKPNIRADSLSRVEGYQFNATFRQTTEHIQWVYGVDVNLESVYSSASQLRLDSQTRTPSEGKFPADASYQGYGLFGMMELDLHQGHGLNLGLRQSRFNLSGTLAQPLGRVDETYGDLTPSVGFNRHRDTYFVSISASKGFRTPSLEDALSVGPSNGGYDVPNPGLEPEAVWSYELLGRVQMGEATWEGSLFTAHYQGLMDRTRGTWLGSDQFEGEPVYFIDNIGSARVEGLSLAYSQSLGERLQIRTDAAWVYGQQTDRDVPMTRIAPIRGNLKANYALDRWTLSALYSWSEGQDRLSPADLTDSRIPLGGTPGYGVLSVRGRYEFNDLFAGNLGLENLTDKLYKQHGSGIYEPGRRALLELEARWK